MKNDQNVARTVGHFIDGQHVADTARTQPVFDPATGLSQRSVALASTSTNSGGRASGTSATYDPESVRYARVDALMSRACDGVTPAAGTTEGNTRAIAALMSDVVLPTATPSDPMPDTIV